MQDLRGSIVALVTPFKNGMLDKAALKALITWHIQQGTQGIVACGTTGETFALSRQEYCEVVRLCVEIAQGRCPVIAGVAAIETKTAEELAKEASNLGASALLVLTPPYIKPSPEGLYQHFVAIHEVCDLPLLVYNCPSRSALDISLSTLERLRSLPRVIGIKDATGDLSRPARIRQALGAAFLQFSGDDATTLAYLAEGGHGCISVTANVAPHLCAALHQAFHQGNFAECAALRDQLCLLHEAMFVETNPVPVKFAAALLNLCEPSVRPPLAPLQAPSQQRVKEALKLTGLEPYFP